ncbi:MAG TPA: hypothetical protein VKA82_01895, partial [Rubrobacter sp.]|nr:hypothetical protein [Rubrobacter sp.]
GRASRRTRSWAARSSYLASISPDVGRHLGGPCLAVMRVLTPARWYPLERDGDLGDVTDIAYY